MLLTFLKEGQQATVLQLPASANVKAGSVKAEQRAEPGDEQLSLAEASAIAT